MIAVRIIAVSNLTRFSAEHPETKRSLDRWVAVMLAGAWGTMAEIQKSFPKSKVIGNRVRFELAGGNFRLIVAFKIKNQIAFIKFAGTHKEYDAIDAATVSMF